MSKNCPISALQELPQIDEMVMRMPVREAAPP
jgi:hypothetical protein